MSASSSKLRPIQRRRASGLRIFWWTKTGSLEGHGRGPEIELEGRIWEALEWREVRGLLPVARLAALELGFEQITQVIEEEERAEWADLVLPEVLKT